METEEIRELIRKDELWKFYKSREWMDLKEQILKENHYECRICKNAGKITRYDIDKDENERLLSTVHHVCHVRDHPELALSRTYMNYETGQQEENLIPVCKACHNSKCHPEKAKWRHEDKFMNEERW